MCEKSVPLCKVKALGGAGVGLGPWLCSLPSESHQARRFSSESEGLGSQHGAVSPTDYPQESLLAESLTGANYR